jgi:type VI secretion system protein ImpB
MSTRESIQEFIERNRPPRVQVSYKLDPTGDAKVELPFIIGVMGNFKGKASDVPIDERGFADIDQDNISEKMEKMGVGLDLQVKNTLANDGSTLGVELKFGNKGDFRPGAIAGQVPELQPLLETRKLLSELKNRTEGKAAAERLLGQLLAKDVPGSQPSSKPTQT